MPKTLWYAAILCSVMNTCDPAMAHEEADWINKGDYRDPVSDIHCCGPEDCRRIDASKVEPLTGGDYNVTMPSGQIHRVKAPRVMDSPTSHYWVCYKEYPNGEWLICFFAPRAGS